MLVEGLRQKKFKKVVFLTGAGISVAAGIPDFRTPGTGLYSQLQKYDLPYPEAIFEISFFKKMPEPFYKLAKEFLCTIHAKPVKAHKFIKKLDDEKMLLSCFTQNIDGLELDAGLKEDKLVQAHGHMRTAHCIDCKEEQSMKDFVECIKNDQIMKCTKCNEGLVKPDIVFFGEQLPVKFYTGWKMVAECDLVFIMGTALKVMPFAMIPQIIPKDVSNSP